MSSIFACDLGFKGKHCPVIFSAVLFFVLRNFLEPALAANAHFADSIVWKKQKLSLERTPPGKKLRFCIRYFWKMKEKPANLNRGGMFFSEVEGHMQKLSSFGQRKKFGLKSHLRGPSTQPFNYNHGIFYPLLV